MIDKLDESAIPYWLSCFKEKRVIYKHDEHFTLGWKHFINAFGSEPCLKKNLWNLGLLLAKPEAIESGKGIFIRDILRDAGYQILSVKRLNIDAEKTGHLWRYAKGRYTEERFQLLVELMESGSSVLFVLKDSQYDERLPLSIRLTNFKGSTDPRDRSRDSLRAVCGGIQSVFLNYIHTSDEPCDVVRELGILFDSAELQALLRAIKSDYQGAGDGYASDPLSPEFGYALSDVDAMGRIQTALAQIPDPEISHKASFALANCFSGNRDDALLVIELLKNWELEVLKIDEIVLRSIAIAMKRENKSQVFPTCEIYHWNAYTSYLENNIQLL